MTRSHRPQFRTDIAKVCERCLASFMGGPTSKYCRECWARVSNPRYAPTADEITLAKARILLYRQRFRDEEEESEGFDPEEVQAISEDEALDFWGRINSKD